MATDEKCETYRIPEAAAILGIPRSTLYHYVSRGLIEPAFRLGRSTRIPKWWVEDLLAGRVHLDGSSSGLASSGQAR